MRGHDVDSPQASELRERRRHHGLGICDGRRGTSGFPLSHHLDQADQAERAHPTAIGWTPGTARYPRAAGLSGTAGQGRGPGAGWTLPVDAAGGPNCDWRIQRRRYESDGLCGSICRRRDLVSISSRCRAGTQRHFSRRRVDARMSWQREGPTGQIRGPLHLRGKQLA